MYKGWFHQATYITLTAVHLWQNGTGWRAVINQQEGTEAGASGDDLDALSLWRTPARAEVAPLQILPCRYIQQTPTGLVHRTQLC